MAPEALRLLIRWMSWANQGQDAFSPTLDWRVLAVHRRRNAGREPSLQPCSRSAVLESQTGRVVAAGTGPASGGSLRFRRTCVALQIGFSLLLIVAAGLFVRTIGNLRNVNAGFETDHLLAFELDPEIAGYPAAGVAPVEQRVLDAIADLPGVRGGGRDQR